MDTSILKMVSSVEPNREKKKKIPLQKIKINSLLAMSYTDSDNIMVSIPVSCRTIAGR